MSKQEVKSTNRLDLHGIRHQVVGRTVENFVLLNQYTIPLTIICGNSQRMIDIVKAKLDDLDIIYVDKYYGTILVIKI